MQVINEDPKCNQTKTSTLTRKMVSSSTVASETASSEMSVFSAFLQHKRQVGVGGQSPTPTRAARLACELALQQGCLLKAHPLQQGEMAAHATGMTGHSNSLTDVQ